MFEVRSYKKRFDANKVKLLKSNGYPYIVRMGGNNGQKGFIDEDEQYLNPGNTISFGQDTATMFYQEYPYFTGDKIKILVPKDVRFAKNNSQFFLATMRRTFQNFSWGTTSFSIDVLKDQILSLPITPSGQIDFAFMENFIRELEEERIRELAAYLKVSGLSDSKLSESERKALDDLGKVEWQAYNIKSLFGASTRGKRLKSDDRIPGVLPFVTAGEAEQGVSAFIGNIVEVFQKNTTTIDMFGSAKYRNYEYGADDHVAVVHTEELPNHAAMFVTTACHKAAHTGAFDYGRNFYAKDADALNIMLAVTTSGSPDYSYMETFMRAVQKLVVKDVADYAANRISATKKCVYRTNVDADNNLGTPEEETVLKLAADENAYLK